MSSFVFRASLAAILLAGCPHATTEQSKPPGLTMHKQQPSPKQNPFHINDPAVRETGRALYLQPYQGVSCASCHGSDGDGHGAMFPYIEPRPPSFSAGALPDAFAKYPESVFHWVSQGVKRTPMPAFSLIMSSRERWLVITYAWKLGSMAKKGRH